MGLICRHCTSHTGAGGIETHGDWYRNFKYRVEQERGLDFHEDLFSPFALTFEIDQTTLAKKAGLRVSIIASTERRDAKRADDYRSLPPPKLQRYLVRWWES